MIVIQLKQFKDPKEQAAYAAKIRAQFRKAASNPSYPVILEAAAIESICAFPDRTPAPSVPPTALPSRMTSITGLSGSATAEFIADPKHLL